MKCFLVFVLIMGFRNACWAMSPANTTSMQPSMMISSSLENRKFFSLRYEQTPAPEITNTNGMTDAFEKKSTYGIQYADFFLKRWMWGIQLGPETLNLPLYPTLNLQYTLLQTGQVQFNGGLLVGYLREFRYGAGWAVSYGLEKYIRTFVASQWIKDQIFYETARDRYHDNYIRVQSEYLLSVIGVEIFIPEFGKPSPQSHLSFIMGLGYQDFKTYRIYDEEYPANFNYRSGMTALVEVRSYFDSF